MASSGFGSLAAGFLKGYSGARTKKREEEKDEKQNKLILKLMEEQLNDATGKREALELITRRMSGQGDPVPQFSDAPGGLGLEKTGATPAAVQGPPMSLSAMLANAQADPKITGALIRSGQFPQIQQMATAQSQAQAQAELAAALQSSKIPAAEFINSPKGSALAIRAGLNPKEFLEAQASMSASAGKPTANIQDYIFSKKTPDFLPFLQNRSELTAGGTGMGKAFSEAYTTIQTTGLQAGRTINMYSRMLDLNNMIETGKLAPAKTMIAELSQSLGVDVEGLDATQAFRALTNRVALELRNPAGGAGMPGAMSDKDREFLMNSVPGLTLTSEGNKLIAEYAVKMAERDKEVFAKARAFVKKNGALNSDFFDELESWSAAHPLFSDADVSKASGGGWAIVK